jgi:GntR family transcriptional regulator/MocR family aminotransferase
MAMWVRFNGTPDVEPWAARSVQHGLWWHPGRRYAFDGKPLACARFSFAFLNERELPEAVRRLAAARSAR